MAFYKGHHVRRYIHLWQDLRPALSPLVPDGVYCQSPFNRMFVRVCVCVCVCRVRVHVRVRVREREHSLLYAFCHFARNHFLAAFQV
jgi:hypothetical protein